MDDYYTDATIYGFELAYLKSRGGPHSSFRRAVNRMYARKIGKLISVMAVLTLPALIIQANA